MVRSTGAVSTTGGGGGGGGSTSVSTTGGTGVVVPTCKELLPHVPYITSLIDFLALLETLRTSIDYYYPSTHLIAPLTAPMKISVTANVTVFARLMWVQKYKSIYGSFDIKDIVHINLLKDVYSSIGYDWKIDKLLNDWPNNIA